MSQGSASRVASAMARGPRNREPRYPIQDPGRGMELTPEQMERLRQHQAQSMERFPTVLPDGAQKPQYPNMERFPVVRPDPDPKFNLQVPPHRQRPQQPLERLSPGVYRAADGSLVNQQGQRMPNQPERAPQGPQQLPNPYLRDRLGGAVGGAVSGPFNAPWQGAPGMYQPPPENVYIGRGMHMPIPQPGIPYPNAGDPMWQQTTPYAQSVNNAIQGMQQGQLHTMIGNKPGGPLTPQQQMQMNQAVQGFQPGASGAAANYYRR